MGRKLTIITGGLLVAAAAGIVVFSYEPERPVVTIAPSGKLLLAGVTIVDTRDGTLSPGMAVLTDRGFIVSITAAGVQETVTGAQVIDAQGKFLVPGFNDYHAHPLGPDDPSGALALMLANGITGFRQMSGSPEMLKERRERRLPTGRYSPAALTMPGSLLTPFNADNPEQAAATVRSQEAQGADFIKVGLTSPAAFFAAQAEAKRIGLPFAGHLQQEVDAVAASKGGMKAIEHLGPGDKILVTCSTDEAALRQEIAKLPPVISPPVNLSFIDNLPVLEKLMGRMLAKKIINPVADADAADVGRYVRIANTFSEDKCRALAAVFVANGTWHVPTLIRIRTSELGDLPEYANDPNLRYMPSDIRQSWHDVTATYNKKQTTATKQAFRVAYALQLRLTKLFDDAGVRMLAGSDSSGAGWEVPGFALHQEFDELAKAGISPLRILQMTTLNGAEFLGRTTMGTVASGKNADLVLLDANPIESAQNLHKVAGVVRAGYYYSRRDLDDILARVQAGNGYFH